MVRYLSKLKRPRFLRVKLRFPRLRATWIEVVWGAGVTASRNHNVSPMATMLARPTEQQRVSVAKRAPAVILVLMSQNIVEGRDIKTWRLTADQYTVGISHRMHVQARQ